MTREFFGATANAQHAINMLLSLPASGKEQDWELELANPDRIEEMLDAFLVDDLKFDEKCAVALLMCASVEEAFEVNCLDPVIVDRVKIAIEREGDVHEAMKFYWIEQGQASNEELLKGLLLG
jgi:hypothetical protein